MRNFLNDMKALVKNEDGVVSFEYVIVAACVVGAVGLAFGTGAGGAIKVALSNAISAIVLKITNAVA